MCAPASVDDMLRIVRGLDVNAHTSIGLSPSVLSYVFSPFLPIHSVLPMKQNVSSWIHAVVIIQLPE